MTTEWKEITDPEELFKLKREGWEIQIQSDAGNDKYCPFKDWDGRHWNIGYLFRARPRQPKMKKVKLEAWLSKYDGLRWIAEGMTIADDKWTRQPHLDLEAEVPDEQ